MSLVKNEATRYDLRQNAVRKRFFRKRIHWAVLIINQYTSNSSNVQYIFGNISIIVYWQIIVDNSEIASQRWNL